MHMVNTEKNFWGGYAVVGGHLPLAAGIALAEQYRETDNAVLCYMGDGATNIGYFHESLNLAGVWKLPVLWIVENNQYGMGTAVERASAITSMPPSSASSERMPCLTRVWSSTRQTRIMEPPGVVAEGMERHPARSGPEESGR